MEPSTRSTDPSVWSTDFEFMKEHAILDFGDFTWKGQIYGLELDKTNVSVRCRSMIKLEAPKGQEDSRRWSLGRSLKARAPNDPNVSKKTSMETIEKHDDSIVPFSVHEEGTRTLPHIIVTQPSTSSLRSLHSQTLLDHKRENRSLPTGSTRGLPHAPNPGPAARPSWIPSYHPSYTTDDKVPTEVEEELVERRRRLSRPLFMPLIDPLVHARSDVRSTTSRTLTLPIDKTAQGSSPGVPTKRQVHAGALLAPPSMSLPCGADSRARQILPTSQYAAAVTTDPQARKSSSFLAAKRHSTSQHRDASCNNRIRPLTSYGSDDTVHGHKIAVASSNPACALSKSKSLRRVASDHQVGTEIVRSAKLEVETASMYEANQITAKRPSLLRRLVRRLSQAGTSSRQETALSSGCKTKSTARKDIVLESGTDSTQGLASHADKLRHVPLSTGTSVGNSAPKTVRRVPHMETLNIIQTRQTAASQPQRCESRDFKTENVPACKSNTDHDITAGKLSYTISGRGVSESRQPLKRRTEVANQKACNLSIRYKSRSNTAEYQLPQRDAVNHAANAVQQSVRLVTEDDEMKLDADVEPETETETEPETENEAGADDESISSTVTSTSIDTITDASDESLPFLTLRQTHDEDSEDSLPRPRIPASISIVGLSVAQNFPLACPRCGTYSKTHSGCMLSMMQSSPALPQLPSTKMIPSSPFSLNPASVFDRKRESYTRKTMDQSIAESPYSSLDPKQNTSDRSVYSPSKVPALSPSVPKATAKPARSSPLRASSSVLSSQPSTVRDRPSSLVSASNAAAATTTTATTAEPSDWNALKNLRFSWQYQDPRSIKKHVTRPQPGRLEEVLNSV